MSAELAEMLTELSRGLDQQLEALGSLDDDDSILRASELLEQACDQIYETFSDHLPADRIGIALLEDDGAVLRSWWVKSSYPEVAIYRGYSAPLANSFSLQQILESGEPRILNDLRAYLAEHPGSRPTQRMLSEGIRSSLTVPLIASGSPVGFMFFSSRRAGSFEPRHIDLLSGLAGQISTVLERTRLLKRSR